ncbi:hypothetical protein T07_12260 [Trichinella nelsoni]|uniref:Uncharacterized protein n=1 Tax=Trichinella nelsoni TaxID=6336 RepID=A0A0V0SCA0_9BILA|nr:hypothetical protein T07_12260 [Trichinella nelsoni]
MPSFQVGSSKPVALRIQVASAGRECVAKFENQPRKQPIDGGNGKLKNGFVHDHFGDSQPSIEPPQEGSPAIQSLLGRGWNPASGDQKSTLLPHGDEMVKLLIQHFHDKNYMTE